MAGLDPISAIASLTQTAIGVVQTAVANKKLKKLFKQRTTFQTPQEVFDIVNSSQSRASQGYDAKTLDYLTDQAGRGFASSVGAATRLGADPNVISGLNDQYLMKTMDIGSNNAMLQLQNFDKFLNAKQLMAQNKEAEWQSKENLIKDQMQMYSQQAQAGQQNIQSGVNLGLSAYTAGKSADLWTEQFDALKRLTGNTGGGGGGGYSGNSGSSGSLGHPIIIQ